MTTWDTQSLEWSPTCIGIYKFYENLVNRGAIAGQFTILSYKTGSSNANIYMKIHKIFIVVTSLGLLFFCLIFAMFRPIDGVGILALCASIIFFSLMLLRSPKKGPIVPGGGGESIGQNASDFIEYGTGPVFIGMLFNIFLSVLSYIEGNLDKISDEQSQILKSRLNNMLNELNENPRKPPHNDNTSSWKRKG